MGKTIQYVRECSMRDLVQRSRFWSIPQASRIAERSRISRLGEEVHHAEEIMNLNLMHSLIGELGSVFRQQDSEPGEQGPQTKSHCQFHHDSTCSTTELLHSSVCNFVTQSSSSIMLLIPRNQISLRNSHNLMRHSAIVILDNSLSILVPLPPGDQVNPAVIVDTTQRQPIGSM